MITAVIKMMGLDPKRVDGQIEDIRKSLYSFASNTEIVRRQNSAIMAHLGIPDVTETPRIGEIDNGQQPHNGGGQPHGSGH